MLTSKISMSGEYRQPNNDDFDFDVQSPERQSFCGCLNECCVRCCIPCACSIGCCCIPYYARDCRQQINIFTSRHPKAVPCVRCCCYIVDVLYDCNLANTKPYYQSRKKMYGDRNCMAAFSKVVVQDPEVASRLLTTEQNRGPYLGLTDFARDHLSRDVPDNNRQVLLLVMNGDTTEGASQSDHTAFREAFLSLSASKECFARLDVRNPVMKSIVDKLEVDLNACRNAKDVTSKAIPNYLLRALHWGMLALDLSEGEFQQLWQAYYKGSSPASSNSVLYHLRFSENAFSSSTQQRYYDNCESIYGRSPLLAEWQKEERFNMLTKHGMIILITRVFTIAGLQGPLSALSNFVTNIRNFDIPVDDRDELRLCLLESMRIHPSVDSSTIIPSKPFKCPFQKASITAPFKSICGYNAPVETESIEFPAGTPVAVSLTMQGMNPNVWANPDKFDPISRRDMLWGKDAQYVMFAGVGDNGPRLCPGRDIALEIMITALQVLYDPETANNRAALFATKAVPNSKGLRNKLRDLAAEALASGAYAAAVDTSHDPLGQYIDDVAKAWSSLTIVASHNKKPERDATTISAFSPKEELKCKVLRLRPNPLLQLRFAKIDEDNSSLGDRIKNYLSIVVEGTFRRVADDNDQLYYYDSPDQAKTAGMITFSDNLPSANVEWDNKKIETSLGLQLFVFYGLGQAYLTVARSAKAVELSDEIAYEVDVSFLSKYKVRPRYEPYGSIAFFRRDKSAFGIWLCNEKRLVVANDEDPAWKHAMARFRSCMCLSVTLKDHLAHVHLVVANGVSLAVRETLSPNHPIRRLLKPHIFHTASVNMLSDEALLHVNGLPYHGFAVDANDYENALMDCLDLFEYQTFPEYVAQKGLTAEDVQELPFFRDGLRLWAIIRNFVSSYLQIFYRNGDEEIAEDRDLNAYWNHFKTSQLGSKSYGLGSLSFPALADQLTHAIFTVTAGHEMYGAIVEYLLSPNVLPPKLTEDRNESDLQTFYLALALISLTGNRMPALINDWNHLHKYILEGDIYSTSPVLESVKISEPAKRKLFDDVIQVLNRFQVDLVDLSNEIDNLNNTDRNTPTKMPFKCCNPRYLDSSVSV